MKFICCSVFLFLSLITSFNIFAENKKGSDWQPVIFGHHKGQQLFYDKNSLITIKVEEGEFNSAILLGVFDKPQNIKIDNGPMMHVRSIKSLVVIRCEYQAILAPEEIDYYSMAKPTKMDSSLLDKIYKGPTPKTIWRIPRESIMYGLLCGINI